MNMMNPILLLASLGLVLVAQAQNCSKPVAGPNMDLDDEYISLDTFLNGSRVYFSCAYGYQPVNGPRFITCMAGTWSPIILECERKNCGSPGEVLNGYFTSNGTEFGDTITWHCNTGHNLVGQAEMRCEDGGWTGRLPTCEVVTCQPPREIANGTYSPVEEVYTYRQTVRYTCQSGLTLNGSASLICSEDGVFTPASPVCIRVSCEDPTIENGEQTEGSRPPHGYNVFVKFECNTGYFMEGQAVQTCGMDSNWSPGLPQCRLATTPTAPTKPTNPTNPTNPTGPAVNISTEDTAVPPKTTPPPGSGNHLFMKIEFPLLVSMIVLLVPHCWL